MEKSMLLILLSFNAVLGCANAQAKDSITAKLNAESKKQIESNSITNAIDPSGNKVRVNFRPPMITDDDLHYNLPIEVYNSLTELDKNRLQAGCWMLDEYERAACKGKRYTEVLKPAKDKCKSNNACINDRLAVVDYCAKHPSDHCDTEQTSVVAKARLACKTAKDGYECRKKKLEELRAGNLIQKSQKPIDDRYCPTCEANKNH